jgi:hypothetical protein
MPKAKVLDTDHVRNHSTFRLLRGKYYDMEGQLTLKAFEEGYYEEYECTHKCTFSLFLDDDAGVFRVRGAHYHTHWGPERVREQFDSMSDARAFARTHGEYKPPKDAMSGI